MTELNDTPPNLEPAAPPDTASRPKRPTNVATPPPPVKLEIYEGPLDLLLDLIRKQEINIYDIPIAKITKQYLDYLRMLEELNVDVAGEFIFMAATLIYIKSRMLLPVDPAAPPEEQEDPRTELVHRLVEHEQFKNAAEMLQSKRLVEDATWSQPGIGEFVEAEDEPGLSVSVFDLVSVFREIVERAKKRKPFEIPREEVTVAEMIECLRNMVRSAGELNLMRFFERASSRRELVTAFLSVLELVRMSEISLLQHETFGEIVARSASPA